MFPKVWLLYLWWFLVTYLCYICNFNQSHCTTSYHPDLQVLLFPAMSAYFFLNISVYDMVVQDVTKFLLNA